MIFINYLVSQVWFISLNPSISELKTAQSSDWAVFSQEEAYPVVVRSMNPDEVVSLPVSGGSLQFRSGVCFNRNHLPLSISKKVFSVQVTHPSDLVIPPPHTWRGIDSALSKFVAIL